MICFEIRLNFAQNCKCWMLTFKGFLENQWVFRKRACAACRFSQLWPQLVYPNMGWSWIRLRFWLGCDNNSASADGGPRSCSMHCIHLYCTMHCTMYCTMHNTMYCTMHYNFETRYWLTDRQTNIVMYRDTLVAKGAIHIGHLCFCLQPKGSSGTPLGPTCL